MESFRRTVAQLVEHRSPKPAAGGSIPSCPATFRPWAALDCEGGVLVYFVLGVPLRCLVLGRGFSGGLLGTKDGL